MPTENIMTESKTRNTNLLIGLIILTGLLICIFTEETVVDRKKTYGYQKNASKSSPLFDEDAPLALSAFPPDTFLKVSNLSSEEAITYFQKKATRAKEIVSRFPDFPRIWLLPPSNKGDYDSLAERYCIEFIEFLFPGYRFRKIRPTWLRNPETKRCLELDGYCKELSLAIEYNGIQHYVWPNFLPMTHYEFLKQQERDQLKAEICIELNICLLVIPYTVPFEKIPLAIYGKLLDAVPGIN